MSLFGREVMRGAGVRPASAMPSPGDAAPARGGWRAASWHLLPASAGRKNALRQGNGRQERGRSLLASAERRNALRQGNGRQTRGHALGYEIPERLAGMVQIVSRAERPVVAWIL